MLQYLVDDHLRGYDLPKIRTKANTCRLIFENGRSIVVEVENNWRWRTSHLPYNIMSISSDIDFGWPWMLYSDGTESTMLYPARKRRVPADRFQLYLM
jgi:hypothetical protein